MTALEALEVSRKHPARAIRVRHGDDRVVLRPTMMADATRLYDAIMASLPELRAYMPWSHLPQTALGQLERLRDMEADYFAGRQFPMMLTREADGEMLALIGLHPRVPLNPRGLELGFWCPTPHTRRGYTTLASRIAALYAFDKLGADRLQVLCDVTNAGSRAVIARCGFHPEGTLRNCLPQATAEQRANGCLITGDSLLFALTPDDLADLPWVAELRAAASYVNLAGHAV
jgi:ribosomal-protein-serine acetyltransferase